MRGGNWGFIWGEIDGFERQEPNSIELFIALATMLFILLSSSPTRGGETGGKLLESGRE